METHAQDQAAEQVADQASGDTAADSAASQAEQPKAEVKSAWPEDWRDQASGGDEKTKKLLDRYNTPADVAKALAEANRLIRSGELKKGLSKEASPEELAAWREENGVPESPDKYEIPEGLTVGEVDKPIVEGFQKLAHEKNLPGEVVKEVLGWYYGEQERLAADIAEGHKADGIEAEEALRAVWGAEYRGNVNQLHSFITSQFGEEMAQSLYAAVLPNGRALFNEPKLVERLAGIARELNPRAMLTQADMTRDVDRERFLESKMGSREWYGRNDWQQEYQAIQERKQKFQKA
jgi:hypothetical protein